MHTKDLFIDNGSDRETIKAIGKGLPELDVVSSLAFGNPIIVSNPCQPPSGSSSHILTFIIEAIYTVDACAFVIASQDEKVFRVFDLVSEQKANSLQGLFSSVYIVSEKQIVGLGWETTILE